MNRLLIWTLHETCVELPFEHLLPLQSGERGRSVNWKLPLTSVALQPPRKASIGICIPVSGKAKSDLLTPAGPARSGPASIGSRIFSVIVASRGRGSNQGRLTGQTHIERCDYLSAYDLVETEASDWQRHTRKLLDFQDGPSNAPPCISVSPMSSEGLGEVGRTADPEVQPWSPGHSLVSPCAEMETSFRSGEIRRAPCGVFASTHAPFYRKRRRRLSLRDASDVNQPSITTAHTSHNSDRTPKLAERNSVSYVLFECRPNVGYKFPKFLQKNRFCGHL